MRRITAGALALILALTFTACGDDKGSDTTDKSSSEQPGEDTESDEVADITDKALAIEDLPAGWAENNDADDGDDDDTLDCIADAQGALVEGKVGDAEVSYIEGATAPQLEQVLAQYDVAGAPAEAVSALDGILDGCGAFEFEDDDGEPITGQIGKVSLSRVPGVDEQASYQMTMESGGFSLSAGILLLAKGDYATMILLLDIGSFDTDQLVELGELAIDKL